MTGADAIIKCLVNEGVEYVFGYPGVAIAPFFDSILDSGIHSILVRQEQNAAHAASGYARISGKTGVVAVTSGPGATNLITGIATAFADSIPMVCITGQVNSKLMGSDVFQEADISGAVESFVKYSYILRDAADIPRVFKEAFMIASTGRKGPVLIDIPIDIQQANISRYVYPEDIKMRTYKPTVSGHAVQIKKVITALGKVKRPILCVGGGVHLSDGVAKVRAFAEKFGIPVVSTMMGLSAMPSDHPLYFGMVGNNGQQYGNRAMNESDMIIMVGARVADRSISQPDLITDNKILVHIDVDPAEIGKNAGPNVPLVGDISHIFTKFLEQEPAADYSAWVKVLEGYRNVGEHTRQKNIKDAIRQADPDGIHPATFIRALSLAMDENAVYVADVGQNQMWSCAIAWIRSGRFLTSGGMGTMGYAVPAAMGAQVADPDRQVVAVCGDGGFQMTMMELATIRQQNIHAKIVVIKNGYLGLVRQYQHYSYKDRYSVVDLGSWPDLEKLTQAYGMDFIRVSRKEEQAKAIEDFLADSAPVLMEVDVAMELLS